MERSPFSMFLKGIVTLKIGEKEYKYDLSKELEDQQDYDKGHIIDPLPVKFESFSKILEENKQKHLKNMKSEVVCICGCKLTKGNLITHMKTKKHAKLMKLKH